MATTPTTLTAPELIARLSELVAGEHPVDYYAASGVLHVYDDTSGLIDARLPLAEMDDDQRRTIHRLLNTSHA